MMTPVLRIPPFPSARFAPLGVADLGGGTQEDPVRCAQLLRLARVGGRFWAADDPWSRFAGASVWRAAAQDETALLARLAGLAVETVGAGRFADCASERGVDLAVLVGRHLMQGVRYFSPFDGAPILLTDAIALLSMWRRLIDDNKQLGPILGIAGWKRPTVSPLLWGGAALPAYARNAPDDTGGKRVGVWKSRTPARVLRPLAAAGLALAEIEDGFIRSSGLGADCVPPLSIIVDTQGIYFDPSQPSALEVLLAHAEIDVPLLDRARALRGRIVTSGIGKYGASTTKLGRLAEGRRHILVAGQVEDDRSVLNGGGAVRSNLALLRCARAAEPNAFILFKPHPDVEAGHRKGRVADAQALDYADIIVRDQPMSALLDMVDGVHVITSLTGFEALLREKSVTTHGTPFYSGWGLTTDRAPVPPRRGRARSLDELVAATLILYPRYIDPLTRLPCPPEILVERIAQGLDEQRSLLTRLRQVQGRISKMFSGILPVMSRPQ